jgi:hypothetical protein
MTDGALAMRYLFDFRGSALTSGATGEDCSRCNPNAIQNYLAGILTQLDVDKNGERDPLTDGLLIVRYLLGARGSSLVSGAVAENCDRCGASAIANYLAGLV